MVCVYSPPPRAAWKGRPAGGRRALAYPDCTARPTVCRHRTTTSRQDERGRRCRRPPRRSPPSQVRSMTSSPAPQEPTPDPDDSLKPLPGALAFVGLGSTVAGCVAVGVGGGIALDAWLNTSPVLLVVGLLVRVRRGRRLGAGAGPQVPVAVGPVPAARDREGGVAVLADLEVGALSRIMRPTALVAGVVGVVACRRSPCCSGRRTPRSGSSLGIGAGRLERTDAGRRASRRSRPTAAPTTRSCARILRTRSAVRLLAAHAAGRDRRCSSGPAAGPGHGRSGLVIFQISFVLNAGRVDPVGRDRVRPAMSASGAGRSGGPCTPTARSRSAGTRRPSPSSA